MLQSVANIMRSVVGVGELACRLGGDEFCLLIKADTRDEVLRFAEFIVSTAQSLIQMPRPSGGGQPPLMCTLSLGACLINGDGDWNDWYAQADAALYRAKRLGGNRIEWQEAVPSPA